MHCNRQIIPASRRNQRPGVKITANSITIHSTGNPKSTAQNEADYVCYNSDRKASYHFVVDEKEIIQVMPISEMAYHSGTSKGNRTSIGIEMCETGNRKKVFDNTVRLVRYLMDTYKIRTVVRHYDWNKKNCPRILIDADHIRDGLNWDKMKKAIHEKGEMEMAEIYNKIEEVPSTYRAVVQWALDKGILKGTGQGLGLSMDNIKALVFLYRYAHLDQ